jgi:hypothetical protein
MQCHRHPGSLVQSRGTYETGSGLRRRYHCAPRGDEKHSFSVLAEGSGARAWSPPPECPKHPGSKVVRNGTYGVRTPRPRQRYRCSPAGGGKAHTLTPVLPREHVHVQEGGCAECEELRGFHHGETTVARRHSWPTRLVARALNELSRGGSYADVSRQALRAAERIAQRHEELVHAGFTEAQADAVVDAEEDAADRGLPAPAVESVLAAVEVAGEEPGDTASAEAVREDRARYRRHRRPQKKAVGDATRETTVSTTSAETPAPAPGDDADRAQRARGKNQRSAESHNVWHIAADWTEAFAPVLFEPVEQRLRERAAAARARLDALRGADKVLDGPQVLLLDDVPVYGRDPGRVRPVPAGRRVLPVSGGRGGVGRAGRPPGRVPQPPSAAAAGAGDAEVERRRLAAAA